MDHNEYLEGCLKTFKKDDFESQVEHCKWAIKEELGEIDGWYKKIFGYKREKSNKWRAEILGEFGDVVYYLTVLSSLWGCDGIVKYLDGVRRPLDNNGTELYISVQMAENANSIAMSTKHNVYIDSIICKVMDNLMVLIEREGFTLEEVMESNLEKLKVRHGDNYKESSSQEEGRDREKEAEALVSKI